MPFRMVLRTGLNRLHETHLDFREAERGHKRQEPRFPKSTSIRSARKQRQHHGFRAGSLQILTVTDFGGECWKGPATTGGDAPISPVSHLLFLAPRGG